MEETFTIQQHEDKNGYLFCFGDIELKTFPSTYNWNYLVEMAMELNKSYKEKSKIALLHG